MSKNRGSDPAHPGRLSWSLGRDSLRLWGAILAGPISNRVLNGRWVGNMRARTSTAPARPYIARLRTFNRLIWPSVWPLLQLLLRSWIWREVGATLPSQVEACGRRAVPRMRDHSTSRAGCLVSPFRTNVPASRRPGNRTHSQVAELQAYRFSLHVATKHDIAPSLSVHPCTNFA